MFCRFPHSRPVAAVGSDPGFHVTLTGICFLLFLTVLKYTQCKIYHFDHFMVALSTFIMSCSHHHHHLQSSLYLTDQNSGPLNDNSSSPAPGPHILLCLQDFYSKDLNDMHDAVCALSYLAYVTQHNVSQVHLRHSACQNHLPFQGWITLHCTGVLLTRSPTEGHVGCFHIFAVANKAVVSTGVQLSLETLPPSVIWGIRPEAGLLGDVVSLLLRNCLLFSEVLRPLTFPPTHAAPGFRFLPVAADTSYCFSESRRPDGREALVCTSSGTDDTGRLFRSCWPPALLSFEKRLLEALARF